MSFESSIMLKHLAELVLRREEIQADRERLELKYGGTDIITWRSEDVNLDADLDRELMNVECSIREILEKVFDRNVTFPIFV